MKYINKDFGYNKVYIAAQDVLWAAGTPFPRFRSMNVPGHSSRNGHSRKKLVGGRLLPVL